MTSLLNTEIEKPVVVLDPECVDTYGLKPCIPEYLTRMRALVRAYGWDLKEIFEKDDPLEWGSVSEHVFRCVMNQKFAGPCGFSNEVVEAIIDFFRTPDGKVFYGRVHELMIQDDNMANRLRLCAEDVAMPMTSTLPLRHCGKPVFSTDPPVPCILERLRTAYYRLRIRIADLFKCCDPECTGLVEEDTFKCMLNEQLVPESGITPIQLQSVANFYRACGSKIDYKRMDSMFESTLGIQEQIQMDFITSKEELKIPKCVKTLCESEEIRLNELLCTIVTRANKKYLTSLSSIFHKFAQKPTGETTVPHLRRFFEYIQTSIAESDFSLVCKKYTVSGYNINFLALIEDLDDKFHKHMCSKALLQTPYGAYTASEDIRRAIPKGAWVHDAAFKPGKCNCAGQSEATYGDDPNAVVDGSRFYEGGPVVGGSGKPPVFGSDYLHKRLGATVGQGFAGTPEHDPPAGKPSSPEYEKCENSDEGYKARMRDCASRMVNLIDVKERVQQYIYKFQIRIKMFFKQYDRLNSGYIMASEFRTALNDMGTSNLGSLDLEEAEIDALINFYRLSDNPNLVCWRKFETDIDSVFIQRGIEKDPLALTPNVDRIIKLPAKGSVDFDALPDKFKRLACCAFTKLKSRVTLERCSLHYFFRGCDRKNSGYVTKEQFESVLTAIHFIMSEEEKDALIMKYSDDKGFYYRRLVNDLEPPTEECHWYKKYVAGRLWRQENLRPTPKWVEHDVQRIMYKLQARMVRNRPRLSNFLKDHDNPNHDRIKIWDFHRAMDRAGFELTPQEIDTLVCCFRSPEDPAEIEWRCFSDAVETCFTVPNLEKAPRFTPGSWRPLKEMDYDKMMSKEEYCDLNEGMRRLAREVRNQNMTMKPVLTDFDYPHTGLVSQDQIHRVLHTFGLANMVAPKELNAIFKRYRVVRGNKNDFDYVEFLANLDGIASMDPIKLEEMSPTGVRWVKQLNSCCI